MINITSIEPKFLIHINELIMNQNNDDYSSSTAAANLNQLLEQPLNPNSNNNNTEYGGDSASIVGDNVDDLKLKHPMANEQSTVNNNNYLMLISAQINGRSISDISLSFKVSPAPVSSFLSPSKSLSLDNNRYRHTNKADEDIYHLSNNNDAILSASTYNLSTISRYKKIPANDQSEVENEDHTNRHTRTNAASFQRTSLNIGKLPLIWFVLSTIVIGLLVLLMSILLIKVHLICRKRKNQQQQQEQRQQQQQQQRLLHKGSGQFDELGNALSSTITYSDNLR